MFNSNCLLPPDIIPNSNKATGWRGVKLCYSGEISRYLCVHAASQICRSLVFRLLRGRVGSMWPFHWTMVCARAYEKLGRWRLPLPTSFFHWPPTRQDALMLQQPKAQNCRKFRPKCCDWLVRCLDNNYFMDSFLMLFWFWNSPLLLPTHILQTITSWAIMCDRPIPW